MSVPASVLAPVHARAPEPSPTGSLRWQALTLVFAVAAAFGIARFAGEMIPIYDGLGWDGQTYAELVRTFGMSKNFEFTPYNIRRIFPSAVLHVVMRATGIARDNPNIILAFQLYTIVLFAVCFAAWMWIVRMMRLGRTGAWVGLIGLFFNYACLKQAFYYSNITDFSAFTLGLLAVALYIARKQGWLLAVAIAGSMTWPTLSVSCALLLLFPYRPSDDRLEGGTSEESGASAASIAGVHPQRGGALATLIALIAVTVPTIALAIFYRQGIRKIGFGPVIAIEERFIALSAAAQALLMFLATRALFSGIDISYVRRTLMRIRAKQVIFAGITLAVPRIAAALIVMALGAKMGTDSLLTPGLYFKFLAILPVTRPLITLVSHFAYFGPVFALIVIYWPRLCEMARAYGPGLMLFLGINLLVAFGPESRQSMPAFPAFLVLLAAVLDRTPWRPIALWGFAGLSLLLSKIWLPINEHPPGAPAVLLDNRYFMNHGPYMENHGYLLHGVAFVGVTVVAYLLVRLGAVHSRTLARA